MTGRPWNSSGYEPARAARHARSDLVTQRAEAARAEPPAAVPRQFVRAICEHREPLGDSREGQVGQASLCCRTGIVNQRAFGKLAGADSAATSGARLRG